MISIEGLDTSVYQGSVDCHAIKKSGRDFIIVKATEGLQYRDPQFPHTWADAKQAGLVRIAYHFLRANVDGAQQAAFMHSYVRANGRFGANDGVMIDLETMDSQSPSTVLAVAEAFCKEIIKETRCGVFLYTGYYFWHDYLGNPMSKVLAKCPLIVASYGAKPIHIDNWPNGITMWQYTSDGKVPGVNGPVDLDRAYCDRATLKHLCVVGGRE